jgi:uncharacterized protein (TIGR00299 family) protein
MERLLYLDCFSGISGDMVLGAFLDAGLPFDDLKRALGSLALDDVEVEAAKVLRAGVSATKFSVHDARHAGSHADRPGSVHDHGQSHDQGHAAAHGHAHDHDHSHAHPHRHDPEETGHHHAHRSLAQIFALIDRSALTVAGRERAKSLFRRLAEAEAAIHQVPIDEIHLHEVGETDSIVDIVGAVYAFEWANVDRIVCSPLNVGGGMVDSAHGRFPVPAPATLRLLTEGGAPIYSDRVQKELVTPTGALIATSYAASFESVPAMTVERIGYGAGDRDPRETPNVLRLMIGSVAESRGAGRVAVIECEIDDMNPQIFGVVMDRLYAAGALEVFYVPVQMKKNRPGTLLTVLGRLEDRVALTDVVFGETTTIGVRYAEMDRECLTREFVEVATPLGRVRFKLAKRNGRIVNAMPEFEDCVRIAEARRLPVKEVQAVALQAYGERQRTAR